MASTTAPPSTSASATDSDSIISSITSSISDTLSEYGTVSAVLTSATDALTSSEAETTAAATTTAFGDLTKAENGKAQANSGQTIETFIASLAVAAVAFAAQVVIFVLIRKRLKRVYQPRTYLVPERRRTPEPPNGFVNWFKPIFNTATSDFISKSGLDAYFFLRYLMMLLKMFTMVAVVILPILLPLNYYGGKGGTQVEGLDRFAWTNVAPSKTRRYWSHLLLAVLLICVWCWTYYDEMRKYIRMRQAYVTSPQHRLKASATTVLVSGIPRKWLTVQKLVELYDAFPGGIRNVWINRNYDDLQEKVDERDKLAKMLEKAETELIILANKNHLKMLAAKAKENPNFVPSDAPNTDGAADRGAAGGAPEEPGAGQSSGNPHQIPASIRGHSPEARRHRSRTKTGLKDVPLVGGGLEKVGAGVEEGFGKLGQGLKTGFGAVTGGVKTGFGAVTGGVQKVVGFERDGERGRATPIQDVESEDGDEVRLTHRGTDFSTESTGSKRGSTLIGKDGRPLVHDRHGRSRSRSRENRRTLNLDNALSEDDEEDEKPAGGHDRKNPPKFPWHKKKKSHEQDAEDRPLGEASPTTPQRSTFGIIDNVEKAIFGKKEHVEYPKAYDEEFANEDWGTPLWRKFVQEKDRPTHRLPLFSWMPFGLPFISKKVDTITYCRKELARLNVEIEKDQEDPEKYPLMNSAFIQFNQQIAAQMCCQSVSHHVPQHMSPRYIEVAPSDVVWGNMRMQWWERYMRSAGVVAATGGLIIGWAFPVAFAGLISQIDYLTETFHWLAWLNDLPDEVIGVIKGVLPPLFLGILMAVLPIILRIFARIQGAHTGMAIEKSVQGMYFAFLFVQVFLVVSISSGITTVVERILKEPYNVPAILAENLPKASNFFFSYLLLQAFTVSAGALLQIATLAINFLLAPILDTTAREKFTRTTTLTEIKWGTFFPVYTNLACIGIVYSVISPLILIFNMITFSLFWLVYRYNLLFVVNFKLDTGGLLFPRALNQLFTGIYIMEICLIGLFFLVRDSDNSVACAPQGIIMIVVTVLTVLYHLTMRQAFGPLITYMPLTLEDDAALRDEEFAKKKSLEHRKNLVAEEKPGDDLNDVLAAKERADLHPGSIELSTISTPDSPPRGRSPSPSHPTIHNPEAGHHHTKHVTQADPPKGYDGNILDSGEQQLTLFADIADEIEDLTPDERDALVARAFQHPAQRAKRPAVWIPNDELGVGRDEIHRTGRMSRGNLWISNEWVGLDVERGGWEEGRNGKRSWKMGKVGGVRFARQPPDFDVRDIMEL